MKFFLQIAFIVRSEARYLLRYPKTLLSGALLAFVPAMYCVLYITSVWDPETKTNALPVAVVNLDAGVQYKEHTFNLGWEITTRLEDSGRFGFTMIGDEQKARALVRRGKLAFAVIIPRDFSASAVPGAEAGAGKVVIYTSQGNNFETAAIAKHFAETLGREINESLNERRWVLVLHNAAGSQRNVDRLHDAVGTLRASARELSAGSVQTAAGVQSLANGARRLNDGVSQMSAAAKQPGGNLLALDAARPGNADLDELAKGANDVAASAANLANAAQKNKHGVEHLSTGIELLAKALPGKVESLGGSAEGLAHSVEPLVEIDAPVENSGSGFASNFVPGALWLGAAMAAFLIHIQVLPRHALFFSRPAQVVGKIFLPACVAVLQSLMVFLVVLYALKIRVVNPWALALALIVSSIAFLSIVFALTKAFGDAGKGIAMFLLAVQLSSSGGIMPVELSGGLFAQISPWLPLTWVVESIKASMFGAYGGAWRAPLVLVGLAGLGAFALSCSVGRWRFVKSTARRPS
jgi:YhgE/Pip-like protein